MKESTRKILYTIVRSQALSSDGRFLFACSNFGDVATYNIEKIATCIENISNEDYSEPISIFKCNETEQPISLAYHRDFLIIGTQIGSVCGYKIKAGVIQKKSWNVQLNLKPDQIEISEVNDLWIDTENDMLYAACATDIHQISLEDGTIVQTFSEHKDYIHSISGCDHSSIVTSSEDGTVKLWDNRLKNATFTLEPSKNQNLQRSQFGTFVGSACVSKEWLACGGGSKLALFHMNQISTRQPFQIFDFPKQIHVTKFVDNDSLLAAGESNSMIQYSLKGNMISEIETSGPAVYSVVWQKKPNKFLSAAGASNKIDFSTNFTYKDATLSFYKKEK